MRFTSVIICTRNRSSFLAEVCSKIVAIDPPPGGWEILIIDNGSTDNSLEIAQGVERDHPDLVRVVVEPIMGLSQARNRGIREAKGDNIAFIDDDAFPATTWLTSLVAALEDPDILCAGGPVDPMFQGGNRLPDWFLGRFLPYLTVWDLGPEPVRLHYNEYPRGANIAYRREAFDRFGLYSTHLGRKGKKLLSCEETEHCLRIERGGGGILYVPEARLQHLTVAERISPEWMARRFRAQGQSEVIINWIHDGWNGITTGMKGFRRRARDARQRRAIDGEVLTRCHRQAWLGYLTGIPAALRAPRFRPEEHEGDFQPWHPHG